MKKLVCYYSGWFECDASDVMMTDMETMESKSVEEWAMTREKIGDLVLDDFVEAFNLALDGDMYTLDCTIEDDDD
jgi:hypothetical protein